MTGQLDDFVARLEAVTPRLAAHALRPAPEGLTDPDEPSGERWQAGQAWAHLAEFVPYWIGQFRLVLAEPGPEPVPFGRVKTDANRVAAIERDREVPIDELWARMQGQFAELRAFLESLTPDQWAREGLHPTLGAMPMPRMVDRFIVSHLEEHADQLDGLVGGRPSA